MKRSIPEQFAINNKKQILINLLCQLQEIDRLKLFKLSFLLGQKLHGFFDFVPYKYGPYSFSLDYDLRKLIEKKIICENENNLYINTSCCNLFLDLQDSSFIANLCSEYAPMATHELIDFIYSNYPYYAQNSMISNLKYIKEQECTPIAIYTFGYEGINVDQFLNILIKKNIKYVIDVRNNPFSYKYGFSKNWLTKYLPEFNITYKNFPGLGIPKIFRKNLTGDNLWEKYLELIDSNQLQEAIDILTCIPSVLMCFESNIENCHRRILSNELKNNIGLPIFDFNQETSTWKKRQ